MIFQDVPIGKVQVRIAWGFSVLLFFVNDVILVGFKVKGLIKRLMNIIKKYGEKILLDRIGYLVLMPWFLNIDILC